MSDRPIRVALYRGAKTPVPEVQNDLTWPELVVALRDIVGRAGEAKVELLAWAPHRLARPYRLAANVEAVTALAIDVDTCGLDALEADLGVLKIAAVVYGSPSDPNPDGSRRVRVVAPTDRDMTPAECDGARLRLAELLGLGPGCGAEKALGCERLWFAGRVGDAPERVFLEFHGAPVQVDALMAEPLHENWTAPAARAAVVLAATAPAATDEIGVIIGAHESHAGARWHICGALGGELRKLGVTRVRGEALIRAWLATHPDPKAGIEWFLGAWERPASDVSGRGALAELVGDEPANTFAHTFAKPFTTPAAELAPLEPAIVPVLGFDTDKKGEPRPTVSNARIVLDACFGSTIRFDEHRRRIVVAGLDPKIADLPDGPWRDHYTTRMRAFCESFGLRMRSSDVLEAVDEHAQRNVFNPVIDWATAVGLAWDGVPRIDQAMRTYWRTKDSHASIVSRIWFLSMAARMLEPGCDVHTVLILHSREQYLGKSMSLRALVPARDWWSDSPLPVGDKDGMTNLLGKVIWELTENASTSKRDADTLKAFFGSSQDTVRQSYARFAEDIARTCVFAITANDLHGILRDATGERRYMPIEIEAPIDVAGLERDRDLLVGEAVCRVAAGEQWWLTADEVLALGPAHRSVSDYDALEDVLSAWLDTRDSDAPVPWSDLASFTGPLRVPLNELKPAEQRRTVIAMRRLGWRQADAHVAGRNVKAFVR